MAQLKWWIWGIRGKEESFLRVLSNCLGAQELKYLPWNFLSLWRYGVSNLLDKVLSWQFHLTVLLHKMSVDFVWFENHIFSGLLENNQSRLRVNDHPHGKWGLSESKGSATQRSTRTVKYEQGSQEPREENARGEMLLDCQTTHHPQSRWLFIEPTEATHLPL